MPQHDAVAVQKTPVPAAPALDAAEPPVALPGTVGTGILARTGPGARPLRPVEVVRLQRVLGNRAVGALLAGAPRHHAPVQRVENEPSAAASEDPQPSAAAQPEADAEFWVRAAVRPVVSGIAYEAGRVIVTSLSISSERRTTARETEQGDHLVAWSAMRRYWEQALTGRTLAEALGTLEAWILSDQIADRNPSNAAARARALGIVGLLSVGEHPAGTMLDSLEHAVSLFVQANQAGSFAVKGMASGGKGEGFALNDLPRLNARAAKETLGPEDQEIVTERARSLVDVRGKSLPGEQLAKVVHTWYSLLTGLYPNLEPYFEARLWTRPFRPGKDPRTVEALFREWEARYADEKAAARGSLAGIQVEPGPQPLSTGVLANLKGPDTPPMGPGAVTIRELEIPHGVRARTRFGHVQGSHTLAWTFERESLTRRFRNKPLDLVLTELEGLAKGALDSLDLGTSYLVDEVGRANVVEQAKQAETLIARIRGLRTSALRLDEWIQQVNDVLAGYVEVSQKLPTTTYQAASQAQGHAEGDANKKFRAMGGESAAYDFQELLPRAARYLDLGIFYLPLLRDSEKYASRKGSERKHEPPAPAGMEVPATFARLMREPGVDVARLVAHATLQELDELLRLLEEERVKKETAVEPAAEEMAVEEVVEAAAMPEEMMPEQMVVEGQAPAGGAAEEMLVEEMVVEGQTPAGEPAAMEGVEGAAQPKKRKRDESEEQHRGDRESKRWRRHLTTVVQVISLIRRRTADEATRREVIARFENPAEYLDALYDREKKVLRKLFGDFYAHLEHFEPRFRADLAANENARAFLVHAALAAPLNENESRIGEALRNHLQAGYARIIQGFRAQLEAKAPEWSKELLERGLPSSPPPG